MTRTARFVRFLFGTIALVAALAGDTTAAGRGITVTVRAGEKAGAAGEDVKLYGTSHALVIGIDRYRHWPRLRNAVEDARAVAGELEARGFNVILKTDLNGDSLNRELKSFFAIKGQDPEARLVLWFAGHGHTINGEGFLVPADAPLASKPMFKVTALHMRDFGGLMRLAESKHVLSVFDSCFSGTIFEARAGAAPRAITRKTTRPVRQFLTSGDAGQEVRDDGSFRTYFLRALRGEERADVNGDGYVTGEELGLFMSQKMAALTGAAQTPKSGKLHDVKFNQGDFVFVLPGTASAAAAPQASKPSAEPGDATFELAFWNSIKDSRNPADYQAYLETYPKGKFAALARARSGGGKRAALRPPPMPEGTDTVDLQREVRRVRRTLETYIEYLNRFAGHDFAIHLGEPMTVVGYDGKVIVELRDLRFVFERRTHFLLGDRRLVVTPLGDGTYDFTATLPETVPVRLEGGDSPPRDLGFISLVEPRLAGAWSTRIADFTALDVGARDIGVVAIDQGIPKAFATIASVNAERDFQSVGRNAWTGSERFTVSGLSLKRDREDSRFLIEEAVIERQYRDMDLKLWNAVGITSPMTPLLAHMAGERVDLSGYFLAQRDWGGMTWKGRIAGLDIREGNHRFLLYDAEVGTTIDGSHEFATVEARGTLGEILVQNLGSDFIPEFVPHKVTVDVRIERVPLRVAISALLKAAWGNGTGRSMERVFEEDVIRMVLEAAPRMTLTDLTYDSPAGTVAASGEAVIDTTLPMNARGRFHVRVDGLDRAISLIAPHADQDYDMREAMGVLSTLRDFVRRDGGTGGGADEFDIELTGDDRAPVTVNGTVFEPKIEPAKGG